MGKIIVFTDGSYINKKGGCAFLLYNENTESNQTIGYASISLNTSAQAELFAVIIALKYIHYSIKEKCDIEIRCDYQEIVDFFNNRIYTKCEMESWAKVNGTPIRKHHKLWQELTYLYKSFHDVEVRFSKCPNRGNEYNNEVHKYARIANREKHKNKESVCILQISKNSIVEKSKLSFDKIDNHLNQVICGYKERLKLINKKTQLEQPKTEHVLIESDKHMINWDSLLKEQIEIINANKIIITEKIHLKCTDINFNANLFRYASKGMIDKPIVVRNIGNEKYSLVMGLIRYFCAKILSIESIPCILTDLHHEDFIELYKIK